MSNKRSETDARRARLSARARESVIHHLRTLKRASGVLLGSFAVSAQVANVLICLAAIFIGPTFVVGLLVR